MPEQESCVSGSIKLGMPKIKKIGSYFQIPFILYANRHIFFFPK